MRFLLAILAGAIYPLGFDPYSLWPITFLSLVLLFGLIQSLGTRALPVLFLFAIGKNLFGVSWVYHSILVFGSAEPYLAGLIVCLFVLILSAFYIPGGLILDFLARQDRLSLFQAILFASVLSFTEWFLTWFLSGFPWLFAGHSMLDTPLSNLLPVFGSLGLGWIIFYSCGSLYLWVLERRLIYLATATLPWVISLMLYPFEWIEETVEYRVALVQANIDQHKKWIHTERNRNFSKHLELSRDHWGADVVIWPEAAITLFGPEAQNTLNLLDQMAEESNTAFISGIPTIDRSGQGSTVTRNSLVAVGDGEGVYSKVHLVPFGEFVPFEGLLRGLIGFFDLPMSSMSAGSLDQKNLTLNFDGSTISAAPAICYEVAYGETIRRRSIGASFIVNVSNDTWFGETQGPWQHLQIARVRALENGKPLLRATNNGVTAVIDKSGDILETLPQFESGVLSMSVRLTSGRTPYSYLGDWPLMAGVLLVLLWGYRSRNSQG